MTAMSHHVRDPGCGAPQEMYYRRHGGGLVPKIQDSDAAECLFFPKPSVLGLQNISQRFISLLAAWAARRCSLGYSQSMSPNGHDLLTPSAATTHPTQELLSPCPSNNNDTHEETCGYFCSNWLSLLTIDLRSLCRPLSGSVFCTLATQDYRPTSQDVEGESCCSARCCFRTRTLRSSALSCLFAVQPTFSALDCGHFKGSKARLEAGNLLNSRVRNAKNNERGIFGPFAVVF